MIIPEVRRGGRQCREPFKLEGRMCIPYLLKEASLDALSHEFIDGWIQVILLICI